MPFHHLRLLPVLLLALCGIATAAPVLDLPARVEQGAIIRGEVPAGSRVWHDGRELRVTPKGRFVVGVDRDAPPQLTVIVRLPDGRTLERRIEVAARQYAIQRIDGLPPQKVTPSDQWLARIRAEAERVRAARQRNDARADFTGTWIWPVIGPITGVYGSQRILNGEPRQPHYGIDIAAPTGTPVRAPAAGIVTLTDDDLFFSGGTLILDHGHGLSSSFLHLHRILVNEGERVEQGDIIAEVGATGRVTGAHLDWRMNWFDRRVDPTVLVPPMPAGS
jgi:murein DD-endopeptidase MepM/ murein hydrolase activator NlpD